MGEWPPPLSTDDLHVSVLREPDDAKRVVLRLANRKVVNKDGKPTSFLRVWVDQGTGNCHVRVNPRFFAPPEEERKRKKPKPSQEEEKEEKEAPLKPKRVSKPLTDDQKAKRKLARQQKKLEQKAVAAPAPPLPVDGRLPLIRDEDFDEEDA